MQAARWRWRLFDALDCVARDACELVGDAENTEHLPVGSCGRGCQQRAPSAAVQLLADGLKGWPSLPTGLGRLKADRRELRPAAEISHPLDIDLKLPELAGHLANRFGLHLGERPIPLGPRSLWAVGEIERLDDRAALPAPVGGIGRACEWVAPGRSLSPPNAVYGGGGY